MEIFPPMNKKTLNTITKTPIAVAKIFAPMEIPRTPNTTIFRTINPTLRNRHFIDFFNSYSPYQISLIIFYYYCHTLSMKFNRKITIFTYEKVGFFKLCQFSVRQIYLLPLHKAILREFPATDLQAPHFPSRQSCL